MIVPILMVAVGMAIPFFYTNFFGIIIGVIIAASSIFVFRTMVKKGVTTLNRQYEETISSLLKSGLVCPKCKSKWEVGAHSCTKCGFSAELKMPKAVKK